MKKQQKIEPKRFYSLGEVVRLGLIPGVTTIPIASRLVRNDMILPRGQRVLDAVRITRGVKGIQYQVQGSNIIQFLVKLDDEQKGI